MRVTPSHALAAICFLAVACAQAAAAQGSSIPRTLTGRPDFQGVWTSRWITPLEREPETPGLVIDKAQASALVTLMLQRLHSGDPLQTPDDYDTLQPLTLDGELRSSLIVDPPDGRLPYTDDGRARRTAFLPNRLRPADHPEQRGDNERCLGFASGFAPYMTAPIANIRQIVQTTDHLVIYTEHYNIARIIPLGPHADNPGDRNGRVNAHWEGDTLEVRSTGFRPNDTARFVPMSVMMITPQTVITERFTRISREKLLYSFTVEDPVLYTRPWTAESAMTLSSDRMYEYACHEGNYGLPNILSGGRALDRKSAQAAATPGRQPR
jgi:hypothetical protein